MLEAHAPHGKTHGWRDFLVHIMAIAIGLLLALALEKVAEYVHERRQLTEARRELAREVAENRRTWADNVQEASRVRQELESDLRIIQAARAHAPLPANAFDYSVHFYAARDGAWLAVRQAGSLSLMPHDELQDYAWFNAILGSLMESMHAFETALQIAGAIAGSAAPERLSAHDLDELATKTMEAQGRLANLNMFLRFEEQGTTSLSRQSAPSAERKPSE